MSPTHDSKHVLVLGAGYAGVLAALRIAKRSHGRARVTLVNASPDFVERIRLHERAAGLPAPRRPLAPMLRGSGVELVVARAESIDAEAREVVLRVAGEARAVAYDYLVYALGSGDGAVVPGAREHASSLASDAASAALAERVAKLPRGGRVAVIGGGLTAIEAAAELAESHPDLHVTLVSRGRVAATLSDGGRAYVQSTLREMGVTLREGAGVNMVEATGPVLEDGEHIPADVTVWAGGFVASDLAARSGLACSPSGQLLLDPFLRALASPHIFGAGDAATIASSEAEHVRMGCVSAMPLGAHAADNLLAELEGRPLAPFGFGFFAQCISLGRRRGIIQRVDAHDRPLPTIVVGKVGAKLKEAVCRYTMVALAIERILPGTYMWPLKSAPLVRRSMTPELAPRPS